MKIMRMNRKAVSLPILLLVITSLVLSILSLTYFIIKENNVDEIITVSSQLDQIYLKQDLLEFYVQDVFDKSIVGINSNSGKQVFIDNFRRELIEYKDRNGRYPINELAFLELKVLEEDILDSVELNEEKLIFRLELTIREGYTFVEDDISLNYNYINEFEKVFK